MHHFAELRAAVDIKEEHIHTVSYTATAFLSCAETVAKAILPDEQDLV